VRTKGSGGEPDTQGGRSGKQQQPWQCEDETQGTFAPSEKLAQSEPEPQSDEDA
jgi:hypothetical protein